MEEKEVLTPEAQEIQNKVAESEAKPDKEKIFEDISAGKLEELYEMDRKEFRNEVKKYPDVVKEKLKEERSKQQKKKAEYFRAMNRHLTGQDLQYILTQIRGVLRAAEVVNKNIDNLEATLIRKGIVTQEDIDSTEGILKKEAIEKAELKKVIEEKQA